MNIEVKENKNEGNIKGRIRLDKSYVNYHNIID